MKPIAAAIVLILLGLPQTVDSTTEPQTGLSVHIDCSAMQRPLHIGGMTDPLECAREWDGKHGGECVEFIQRLYGSYYTDPSFRGFAGDIQPNIQTPAVREAVLINDGVPHAALIYAIEGKTITLVESNQNGDERVTYGRKIDIDSKNIRGFYAFKTTTVGNH